MSFRTLLTLASLSFVTLSSPVVAADYVTDVAGYDGWTFIKNDDGSYSIFSVEASKIGESLVIPGTIKISGTDVSVSGVVSKDVSSTGNGVFYSATNLKTVTIESGIKTIGSNAFSGCSGLTKVKFNGVSHVESIGDYAFNGCTSLEKIALPESVKVIGQSAFVNCSKLKTVSLPSTLTEIGACAFQFCSSLTTINFPEGLKSIGSMAFTNCVSLTSITIPGSVETIGQQAFKGCSKLTSVTIEDSETVTNRRIEQYAFSGVPISTITIPGSISVIENNAFENCQELKTVVIGDGVGEIQGYAFGGCNTLLTVTFESTSIDNLPSFENNTFTDWRISNGVAKLVPADDADYEFEVTNGVITVKNKTTEVDPTEPTDPTDPTAIKKASVSAQPVAYYSLTGAKLSAPRPGVVIAIYSDGSSSKFLVK